ncbi:MULTISPECIES: ABC transporter permease [unclassified Kribbella]|uniref:ABC transporter permease n=1 Tax=unclassified Kribbella TaxID=2644121 RepID=UPI0030175B2C
MSFDTGLGLAAIVVLPLLIAIGVGASRYAGLRHDKGIVTAALRAVVQLTAVGLVVGAALQHTLGAIAFVLVMFVVATFTSTRRIRSTAVIPRQWAYCAIAIGSGAFVVLLLLILPGVVPRNPATILPMGGIIIGGTMTATTLAGRRVLSEYGTRYGEFEAGLTIGLLPRDAFKLVVGPVAGDALLPALDQTRTVGLVSLPGAFVGMVLGGASPTEAAALQLVVLIGLVAAQSLAILTITELLARSPLPDGRTVSS